MRRGDGAMNSLPQRLATALDQLDSGDLEVTVGAVDELAVVVNGIVDRIIDDFEKPGAARYMIFERLSRFGTSVVDPLEQLLNRTGDPEVRTLTAAALLANGSQAGLQDLLRSVRADDPLVCIAVRVLTMAGIVRVAELIEVALLECDLKETDILACLVDGLRNLGRPVPGRVGDRLQSVEPSWLRNSLLS